MADNHISLQEALDIIDSSGGDVLSLSEDPRLNQFISDVEDSSMEVLKSKEKEYVRGAVTFIQTCAIAVLISQCSNADELMSVLKLINNKTITAIITVAFKMSVGLSIIEELR